MNRSSRFAISYSLSRTILFPVPVEELPTGKPFARPRGRLLESHLAVGKDVHRPPGARHRNVKLCFIRLVKRTNRHANDDLVNSLGLARVTGRFPRRAQPALYCV